MIVPQTFSQFYSLEEKSTLMRSAT